MPSGGASLSRAGDASSRAAAGEASTSGRSFRLSDVPARALAGATALARVLARPEAHDDNTVLAGTLARTAAQVFVHPIDTIKTRLQVSDPPKKLRKWRKKLVKAKNQLIVPVGRGGRTLTVPNWAYKGPGDIYRGLSGAIIGTLPTALVYFTVYDRVSAALEERLAQRSGGGALESGGGAAAAVHLVSAAAGAIASSVVRVPGDTCRHQTQAYMHRNFFAAAHTIVSNAGFRGLYLGYLPTLLRDVPELAVQFTVYEALRREAQQRRARADAAAAGAAAGSGVRGGQGKAKPYKLATWEHLVLGGAAGAAAATVTMPLDFIKTRQQCGATGGAMALVRGVLAAEGAAGLFRGLGARVCHVAATSACFFGCFEFTKLLLKPDRTEADRLLLPKLIRKRRDHVWKRQLVLE